MLSAPEFATSLPRALSSYPDQISAPIVQLLIGRARIEPFNAIATAIFALAIIHTFGANQFSKRAHHVQHMHDQTGTAGRDGPRRRACGLKYFTSWAKSRSSSACGRSSC